MTCQIEGCSRETACRGYCKNHYIRERNKGRIPVLERPSPIERFRKLVAIDPETGCHNWQGAKTRPDWRGYGLFAVGTKTTRIAHRWLWEQTFGPLPRAIQLDHIVCNNRACVNLSHLKPATPKENVGRALITTHCKRGHLRSEHSYVASDGRRRCRPCKVDRDRRSKERRSEPEDPHEELGVVDERPVDHR